MSITSHSSPSNVHDDKDLRRPLVLVDLHGRVRDGLDLGALGVLAQLEGLADPQGADLDALLVAVVALFGAAIKVQDLDLEGDEERVRGEVEEPLVQEGEQRGLQVVALSAKTNGFLSIKRDLKLDDVMLCLTSASMMCVPCSSTVSRSVM